MEGSDADNATRKELARDYAGRFWQTGNSITTLMFGLAFSFYLAAAQGNDVRLLIQEYFEALVALAVIGNGALFFLIHRSYRRETELLTIAAGSDNFGKFSYAGYRMRVGLFVFNFILYIVAITLIWWLTKPA